MSDIRIYQKQDGMCQIPFVFIDEYMKDANDVQLKVYLYLLRRIGAGLNTGIADMADTFNESEKEIIRALNFWQKAGVLALEHDDGKQISGVHILPLGQSNKTSAPIEVKEAPAREMLVKAEPAKAEPAKDASIIASVKSPEELGEFAQGVGAQAIFLAEMYLGRTLSLRDMQSIHFIREGLGYDDDMVDALIQYCVEKGKRDFRYIEKVAMAWKDQGIVTPEQAREESAVYNKSVYAVMNHLGKKGAPSEKEMEFIRKWTTDYGLGDAVILEACDRTVLATDSHRFQYADGILKSWKEKGVSSVEDIARVDEKKAVRPKVSVHTISAGQFGNFSQNDIDFDALEKKLLNN